MAIKKPTKRKHSSLAKRQDISYETKDRGGVGSRVINWRGVEGNVVFFQPTLGKNAINIIPFEIKNKNHPLVKNGSMSIGDYDYCLDIWVHRNIGPSESGVVCLKKTFGKACPVCEEADKLTKAGKKKEAGDLKASRRCFYNIEDIRKKPGELQVFEVSHFLFENELIEESRDEETGEKIEFSDPDDGKVVKFRAQKITRGGFEFNEYKSFSFEEREEPIDEDLLAKAISFDEFLNVPTYEEVQRILYGADEDEGDDESEEDDDDRPKRPAKNKKPVRDEDDDDDEEEDEEEEDEPPKKKPKRRPVEDDEEEEDDEPPAKKKSSKPEGKGKCPHGHTFGEDADEYKECEKCDIWAKCSK